MEVAQRTFDQYKEDLARILGDILFEIIIYGSYALDDFQPGKGDLDYMVVTNESLDESMNARLFELHDKYRQEKKLLLYQLEGTFYPKHYLHSLSSPFTGCYIGTSRKGWCTINSFRNSLIDLKMIRECGICLLGKDVEFYNPSDAEIVMEFAKSVNSFISCTQTHSKTETGMWVSIIHLSARILFYLSKRRVVSKTEACRWCHYSVELQQFSTLFKFAENRRYPYENAFVADYMSASCILLLEYTKNLLLSII